MDVIKNFMPGPKAKLSIDIEDLLNNKIGYGHWQRVAVFLLTLPSFIGGLIVLNATFTTAVPKNFTCRVSGQFIKVKYD